MSLNSKISTKKQTDLINMVQPTPVCGIHVISSAEHSHVYCLNNIPDIYEHELTTEFHLSHYLKKNLFSCKPSKKQSQKTVGIIRCLKNCFVYSFISRTCFLVLKPSIDLRMPSLKFSKGTNSLGGGKSLQFLIKEHKSAYISVFCVLSLFNAFH